MTIKDMVNITFYVLLLTVMIGNAHWSVVVAFSMLAAKDCLESHRDIGLYSKAQQGREG